MHSSFFSYPNQILIPIDTFLNLNPNRNRYLPALNDTFLNPNPNPNPNRYLPLLDDTFLNCNPNPKRYLPALDNTFLDPNPNPNPNRCLPALDGTRAKNMALENIVKYGTRKYRKGGNYSRVYIRSCQSQFCSHLLELLS